MHNEIINTLRVGLIFLLIETILGVLTCVWVIVFKQENIPYLVFVAILLSSVAGLIVCGLRSKYLRVDNTDSDSKIMED